MALINKWKTMIPTWFICIWFFFGVFIWPMIIGIGLIILQALQKKKISNSIQSKEEQFNMFQINYEAEKLEVDKNHKNQISKLNQEINELSEKTELLNSELNECKKELDEKENRIIGLQRLEDDFKSNKGLETQKIVEDMQHDIYELELKIKNKEHEIKENKNIISKQSDTIQRLKQYEPVDKNEFILCAGKYKGGKDIPIGNYNLRLISGYGFFEINKPEDLYFGMTKDRKEQKDYGWTEEYKNIEISNKSIIKISDSAKIQFNYAGGYNYEWEIREETENHGNKKEELEKEYMEKYSAYCENYNRIQSEIEIVKGELKILNNEAVKKYYIFSDYESVTSQECKNELLILKSKEKELRADESDIVILEIKVNHKITERSIRQILRNFNSECDNIIKNIGLKNIDIVRNKIQKSYDSLNKLYSFDGVNLSKKILELKFKQATLLYTYELKYQQEKDIQQAIKEQMVEEARAEREIQEQKKMIEKDLQQHLGEVNRLMKYMQKTQIDAEKQLYIYKIKELEDKIKVLESDKETVIEREGNAKAGFVYIISNIGSFGENIYKIGMTRRLEPMDRVKELSSASVPFEFDVHAMIFSSDAPDLETMLHHHFADRAVNKINPRKEFYKVGIDEIEQVVKENYNDTVQFTKIPIAAEYRQSMELEMSAE